jgi:N-acetylmuramoyl-L-alanine amidase
VDGGSDLRRTAIALAVLAVTLGATATSGANAPRPRIVVKPIPFGPARLAETRAYARRHYRIDTWRLRRPRVIVEHYTASDSFASAYSTFASNTRNLGELPGVCAHFVIDRDGTIYRLVQPSIMCRHTVGLNWTAIGIEHVGTSDAQILANRRQLDASLGLTSWLMSRYGIRLRNVIGHNESLTSPYHRELNRSWRCETHGDWTRADMQIYRAALARRARRYGVTLGPPARAVDSGC